MPDACGPDPRVSRLAVWEEPVIRVRFVDEARAETLVKLDIRTVGDLIEHYPRRHLDLSSTPNLADVVVGQDVTVVGRVHEVKIKKPRRRLSVTEVSIVDGTGVLIGVWFNQPYMADRFREGDRVAFAGTVTLDYGLRRIRNPLVERLGDDADADFLGRLLPVHPTTEGLSANWLRRLIAEALDSFGDVPDALPASVRVRHRLPPAAHAVRAIHFPASALEMEEARARLVYEEFFLLQLRLALRRAEAVGGPGIAHVVNGPLREALESVLPFVLTGEQDVVLQEILADMASETPMNRLLLGDVGTGKTAVAAIAMAAAVDGDHQAAMMAPTEVLAAQYAHRLGPLFDIAGVAWGSLTGSTTATERSELLERLATGDLSIALGTHALFSEDVRFASLGLVIIDEQHRFGVTQRLSLRGKGERADLLVMTATPIPRTLALTLYGDLDASYLRERPTGRSIAESVTTRVVHRDERSTAYDAIRRAVSRGRQVYVVCPLVAASEEADLLAATDEVQRLGSDIFPELTVGLLTGRMTSAEKAAAMETFYAGKTDVLVTTTVVEVGVDVPNATVMLVESAERFGLAQLHQLRGRVARGPEQGEFLLFADTATDEGRRRMAAIESETDGFALAEIDLGLRGEGEVAGVRQSGIAGLRIASLLRDTDVLESARRDVCAIIEKDGASSPVLAAARLAAKRRFPDAGGWAASG